MRLNRGVNLAELRERFGVAADKFNAKIAELTRDGLLVRLGENLQLTARGRLLSNEVFGAFIGTERSAIQTIAEAG